MSELTELAITLANCHDDLQYFRKCLASTEADVEKFQAKAKAAQEECVATMDQIEKLQEEFVRLEEKLKTALKEKYEETNKG